MNSIKHKVVVLSGKGGVGKTMIAANVAYELSNMGYAVGLLDADINNGTIGHVLGVTDQQPKVVDDKLVPVQVTPHLKVMAMDLVTEETDTPLIIKKDAKKKAIDQYTRNIAWGDLDFLIVDPPTGIGETVSEIVEAVGPKAALIVTTPQEIALKKTKKAITFARKHDLLVIGLVENVSSVSCPECGTELLPKNETTAEYVAMEMGIPYLGSIPFSEKFIQAGNEGHPLTEAAAHTDAFEKFKNVVRFVKIFLEG
jgi:Mrp family chromosome partitioning ATPase